MKRFTAALIGYGHWGPIVLRNFDACEGLSVSAVCDRHQANLEKARGVRAEIKTTLEAEDVLGDPGIDVIAVTTQASSHYELVKKALQNGKHVFVEKPFTLNSEEGRSLAALAEQKKRILMVDHTFLFTPAFERAREIVRGGELGRLQYYYSLRAGFGVVPRDASVLWHLIYHDVYILLGLAAEKPLSARAALQAKVVAGMGDSGNLVLSFNGGLTAFMHASLVFAAKRRDIILGGDKKMLVWNEMEPPARKLALVARKARWDEETGRVAHEDAGCAHVPVADVEALARETAYLVDCLRTGQKPVNGPESALAVTGVLEAAERSLKAAGTDVSI